MYQPLYRPFHFGQLFLRHFQLLRDEPRLDGPIAGSADQTSNRFFNVLHVQQYR